MPSSIRLHSLVVASSENVAFTPVFLKRQMSGHQYLTFCLSSGLINETTFSYDKALMVLKKVTKNVRAHAEHHVRHHHSHHRVGGEFNLSEVSACDLQRTSHVIDREVATYEAVSLMRSMATKS